MIEKWKKPNPNVCIDGPRPGTKRDSNPVTWPEEHTWAKLRSIGWALCDKHGRLLVTVKRSDGEFVRKAIPIQHARTKPRDWSRS